MRNKRYTMPFTPTTDMEIDKVINKYGLYIHLQALRSMQHKSQEEMSTLSGLSVGTISRLETGGNITVNNLIRYAHSLGYEVILKKMEQETKNE